MLQYPHFWGVHQFCLIKIEINIGKSKFCLVFNNTIESIEINLSTKLKSNQTNQTET